MLHHQSIRPMKNFTLRNPLFRIALYSSMSLALLHALRAQPASPTNDNFAQATVMIGFGGTWVAPLDGATLEPGEPEHAGGLPCKSVWWRWQAPMNGELMIGNWYSTASNVIFAVYQGASVDKLVLLGKSAQSAWVTVVGGQTYAIAGVAPPDASGEAVLSRSFASSGASYPVPGNLLCDPSFETSRPPPFVCWQVTRPYGACVGCTGGADGRTWVTLGGGSGSPLYVESDMTNHVPLVQKLTLLSDPVSQFLWGLFSPDGQQTLLDGSASVSEVRQVMAQELNTIMASGSIYDTMRFSDVALSPQTQSLLAQDPQGTNFVLLNRMLMDDAYPTEIRRFTGNEPGGTITQEFATIPGRRYEVRFAFRGTSARIRAVWDETELGVGEVPDSETSFWHWTNYTAIATGNTTRLTLERLRGSPALDAISVVWADEPASIVTPPLSLTVFAGGNAGFTVQASGKPPLSYQWYFNGVSMPRQYQKTLVLEAVSETQAGDYFVVVSNAVGAVTSTLATLAVEVPIAPVILLQPQGDSVIEGSYFSLNVSAVGAAPLRHEWSFNGTPLSGATNRNLVFPVFATTNVGVYQVRVWNGYGSVLSLPANLQIQRNSGGGGAIYMRNGVGPSQSVPIFDVDGVSKLAGTNFVAQLYAGPSLTLLRAVGSPRFFRTGVYAGLFESQLVTLPNIPSGVTSIVQVRVWETSKGASYEEARAVGGKFGRSVIMHIQAREPAIAGMVGNLPGLISFSLQPGVSGFSAGRIEFGEQRYDGSYLWMLHGEAGYHYLIEKATNRFDWIPLSILTNTTGVAPFADMPPTGDSQMFYRSRILD